MNEEQLHALCRILEVADAARNSCIDLQLRDMIRSDIRILAAYGAAETSKNDAAAFFETKETLSRR